MDDPRSSAGPGRSSIASQGNHADEPPRTPGIAPRLHADRIAGGHRDHRRADRPAAAGGPGGPRGGPAGPVHQQPEADRRSGSHNYESVAGAFPPSNVLAGTGNTVTWSNGFSVHCRLLPFMEQGVAFNALNFSLQPPLGGQHDGRRHGGRGLHLPERREQGLADALPAVHRARRDGERHQLRLQRRRLVRLERLQRPPEPRRLRAEPEPADRRVPRRHEPDPDRHRREGLPAATAAATRSWRTSTTRQHPVADGRPVSPSPRSTAAAPARSAQRTPSGPTATPTRRR